MTRGSAWLWFSLVTFVGCGGRTDTLFDDQGGGTSTAGGALGVAGAEVAGSVASGGAPTFGGADGTAGTPVFVTGGSPGSAGATGSAGAPIAGAPSFGGSTGSAGAPAVAGSAGVAGSSGAGPIIDLCVALASNSCQKCLCGACTSQVVGCASDGGCAKIFACVEKTGCQGLSCYTNATCRAVIDDNGGLTGSSLGQVFSLAACSLTSACGCN